MAGKYRFWSVALLTLALLTLGLETAVPATLAAEDPKAIIQQAYQMTSNAVSVEDYSEIIKLCGEAQQATLASDQTDYVKSLLAWAHNRRGEVFTEQASQAFNRGQSQQATQLDSKALADFEASLKLDAKRWKTWHNRAVGRAIAGKYQDAVADFSKVIELKPDYANAWFNRGEILYDLGQIPDAIKDYSESIRLNPEDAGAYTSRAHAYFRTGQPDAALADYSKSIELAPDNADLLANRGDALQSLGKWLEAAEDFKAALQINSESPRVLQSTAWLMATCPDANVRSVERAVQVAEKAIQLNGQPDARFLDTLAAAYANANRFDEAMSKISAAIQIATTDQAAVLKKRLELYQRKQPYRQAVGEKTANVSKIKKTR